MSSENPTGDADDQQGRLEAYLAGFVDGEGCFSVGVTRRPDLPFGYRLVPEFRVSQNAERATVLETLRAVLECGRIVENDRSRASDRTHVFVVRRRRDLVERIIPFFERNPLLSEKRVEFGTFRAILQAMMAKEHLERRGFERLVRLAFAMNGGGRYRKTTLGDVVGRENPQRLYAEHPERGEDTVRAVWRHAEPGGNDLVAVRSAVAVTRRSRGRTEVTELSVPIRCARWRLERGCP